MPDHEPDIVVQGYRINYGGSAGGGGAGGGGSFFAVRDNNAEEDRFQPAPEGTSTPPEPTDDDPPRVAAQVTNPSNLLAVRDAANTLTTRVAQLTTKVMSLPNDAIITLKDGSTITGAALKSLWNKVDFLVTDRTDFGTDRGGAVVGNLSQMHFTTVTGYDQHVNGLDFIMLHEAMHMTQQGQAYNALMWEIHQQEGGTLANFNGSSVWFRSGEAFINSAARSILRLMPAGSDIVPDLSNPDPALWMPPWGLE